jgi:hypothetical protein
LSEQWIADVPPPLPAQRTAQGDEFALLIDVVTEPIRILLPATFHAIAFPAELAWAEVDLFRAKLWKKLYLVLSINETEVILSAR